MPQSITSTSIFVEEKRMKFRKKPVVIEAFQWTGLGTDPDIQQYDLRNDFRTPCDHCNLRFSEHGSIKTLEGRHIVCPGDWIITGVKGERYPCKPDIFEATYEKVSDEQ
jgi:hypothetical protein